MKKVVKYTYSVLYQNNNNIAYFEKIVVIVATICILFLAAVFPVISTI